jgi:oligopeptide/dipeptide ABC transporter ATP-binding protein
MGTVLIETKGLKKYFPLRGGFMIRSEKKVVRAVDGIDLRIEEGDMFGLVGESGCGKSTLGRLHLRLIEPTSGTVRFMGREILNLDKREMREIRRHMQMIFQDPLASLNPRKTIYDALSQPCLVHNIIDKDEIESSVLESLEVVGLTPPELFVDRYPHELSGGQRQRVAIARALSLRPKYVVADEPVSSLDVTVRAQVLNLMRGLRERFGLTWLFISHDLSVIRSMCNKVAVMYLGKIVELAEVDELYGNPLHPYTQGLLAATPIPNPRIARTRSRAILSGDVPSPVDPPSGCRFHTRCSNARPKCAEEEPELLQVRDGHLLSCVRTG